MSSTSIYEKLRILLSRIVIIFLVILFIITKAGWEEIYPVSNILFLIGCIMVGIGTLGRVWCSLYIAGYKNKTLITEGPYSMCRNPLYFFSFIAAAGVGFTTETLLIPLTVIIAFFAYYPAVIRSEESRLLRIHGDEFRQYMKSTPSFIPKLSNFKEPDQYSVNPKIFRKNLFDALWFIWIIGLLELVEGLHEAGIIPTFFTLY
jgi:protein-S-isoprenylcysteine O-methyltransferase Ste14